MKRDTMILGGLALGLGLLFYTKKAKADPAKPKPPGGGGAGGGTVPIGEGFERWSPAQAAAIKQALAGLMALPDVPSTMSPDVQMFSLKPSPLGLGAADTVARLSLMGSGDATVWTNRDLSRMLLVPDDDIQGLPNAKQWVLLAIAGEPW